LAQQAVAQAVAQLLAQPSQAALVVVALVCSWVPQHLAVQPPRMERMLAPLVLEMVVVVAGRALRLEPQGRVAMATSAAVVVVVVRRATREIL
jgi:hypothetical protein